MRPNIAWLLVDSIRTYPTTADVRGKLPFMEEFGKEAVEFTTCVTTAPSTIMSITAMMTGLPAYFLARNYDDFRFDSAYHYSLTRLLEDAGYACCAFLRSPETREKFRNLLPAVPRDFWPTDLRHGTKWRNTDLNRLLKRRLARELPRPAFLFFHFNPQTAVETDARVSERVAEAYGRLLDAGFTPENTIYVLCSDHGFPDPSTGMSSEWEERSRLSHDLVLTDDNILVPLYIRYPGCRPGKVDTPVSTLDLFPTLLDLAGVQRPPDLHQRIDGHSLVPLMEGGEDADRANGRAFHRCDSRLMLQTGRSTVIRGPEHKYIRYHDEHRIAHAGAAAPGGEVLVDLRNDPGETKNLLAGDAGRRPEVRALVERYRTEFERSERRGVAFQVEYLLWRNDIGGTRRGSGPAGGRTRRGEPGAGRPLRVLAVFEPDTSGYLPIGLEAFRRLDPAASVDVVADFPPPEQAAARFIPYSVEEGGSLRTSGLEARLREADGYDLSVVFVRDPSAPPAADLLRVARRARSRRRLVVDCAFDVHRRQHYWYFRLRTLAQATREMGREPRLVLDHARRAVRLIVRHVLRRFGRWERWNSVRTGN